MQNITVCKQEGANYRRPIKAYDVTRNGEVVGTLQTGPHLASFRRLPQPSRQPHHPHRQRFTLAHEVGHYLLHFDEAEEVFHRDMRSSRGQIVLKFRPTTLRRSF